MPGEPESGDPGDRAAGAGDLDRRTLNVSVAVQHHPARTALLSRLLASAGPAEVVTDPDPDGIPHPWRTYKRALELTPADATHRVVLQDDVTVCRHFTSALHSAVAAQPERVILLYVPGRPPEFARAVMSAAAAGFRWATFHRLPWLPAVAVVWPAPLIAQALDYVAGQTWPHSYRADDEILGRVLTALQVLPVATVPSLVQHEDVEPSLIGLRARAGLDRSRTAACWIGSCDPLTIDWT